jgi:DNA-directed RNA polymerase subunit RPC12/RpoP
MPEKSALQKAWERSNQCPHCGRSTLLTHTYEYGGEKRRTFTNPKDPAAVAECPRCHGRWFFFERPVTIEVVEDLRTTEVASTDEMVLDNSKGRTPLKRSQSISREWTQTVAVEQERTDGTQTKFGLAAQGVSLETMAEQAVRSKYSISETQKLTRTDELQLDVPAGTKRRLVMTFKRTWQHGKLVLTPADGDPVEVPYKVVADVTLDVAQVDEQFAEPVPA